MTTRALLRLGLLGLLLLSVPCSQAQVTVSGSGSTRVAPNDPTTGTVLYGLAKTGPTGAIRTTPSDTNVPIWIVIGGAGINQNVPAVLAVSGDVPCLMDVTLTNTRGMLVVPSPTNNQQCHPIPVSTPPATGYVAGTMADNSTTAGQTALVSAQLISYTPGSGTGTGSVTSVGLAVPAGFTSSGGPITAAGTLTLGLATAAANSGWFGPASGAAAAPGFRPIVLADLPAGVLSTCSGDLAGTAPNCTVAQASGAFAFPGEVTPSSLSGAVTDYNACANTTICRLSATGGDQVINTLAGGADGRLLNLCNVGAANLITLINQGTGSSANQFLAGANMVVRPNACKPVWYDVVSAKWRPWDSALLEPYGWKSCPIPFGSTASGTPVLPSDDDVTAACANDTGFDWKITSVKVYINAGASQFQPKLTGGANITGACTGAAGVWTNCPVTGTPIVHSFTGADRSVCSTPPCTADANVLAADGVTTYGWLDLSGPLQ